MTADKHYGKIASGFTDSVCGAQHSSTGMRVRDILQEEDTGIDDEVIEEAVATALASEMEEEKKAAAEEAAAEEPAEEEAPAEKDPE